jgi:putative membrane protein
MDRSHGRGTRPAIVGQADRQVREETMHDRDVRGGADRTGARAVAHDARTGREALVRQALTAVTAALTALAALGAAGCGGDGARDPKDEAPARQGGASSGEVANAPGATASVPDTGAFPGTAGSGTGAVGNATGSIGTPGSGAMQSGDPSDAGVRSLLGAIDASEVEASQVALQKAQNAEVKRYAQSMIAAHQRTAQEAPVAAGANTASDLLTPLQDMHRKVMTQLQSTATGPAFDRAYINAQVQAHEGALQTLERAETAAGDPTLVDRVRRTQSEVEKHLAEARRVQAVVSRNAPQ